MGPPFEPAHGVSLDMAKPTARATVVSSLSTPTSDWRSSASTVSSVDGHAAADADDDSNDNDPSDAIAQTRTATSTGSTGSTGSRPPDFEVFFDADDPENPRNWPLWYRAWSLAALSFSTWLVIFYSTSYTAAIPGIVAAFGTTTTVATLGLTTYMMGLAVGCLIAAPLSELWGRRPVYLVSLVAFTIMILPCGLAKSMAEILVVRFLAAVFGAAFANNGPGSVVDLSDEDHRALVMSLWCLAPFSGPVLGPLVGGFVYQNLGWRWNNWIVMIMAGGAIVAMLTAKETYAPTILQRKAARLRRATGDPRWWSRYDEKADKLSLLRVGLLRPFSLSIKEPILWFFNIWISIIYSILYLTFVAYPIVFSEHRGWGPGVTGLSFLGIGTGIVGAILSEPLIRRLIQAHPRDPATGRVPPEAMARVMTMGAALAAAGQLAFSWTCLPRSVHWAVPIAFGVPFGAGNTLSFVYGNNYLASAYGIYAASALAGNAVLRSAAGGTLPLAAPKMYAALTPQWAGTLLGLLEVGLIPVPLAFWRYGERIRARSPVIRRMREDQDRNESKRARHLDRLAAGRRAGPLAGPLTEPSPVDAVLDVAHADRDVEKAEARSGRETVVDAKETAAIDKDLESGRI